MVSLYYTATYAGGVSKVSENPPWRAVLNWGKPERAPPLCDCVDGMYVCMCVCMYVCTVVIPYYVLIQNYMTTSVKCKQVPAHRYITVHLPMPHSLDSLSQAVSTWILAARILLSSRRNWKAK